MNGFRLVNVSLKLLAVLGIALVMTACTAGHEGPSRPDALKRIQPSKGPVSYARLNGAGTEIGATRRFRPIANLPKPLLAKIVVPAKPLQCVPYARQLSNIQIRGNAWTWWDQAAGLYPRSGRPKAGSVMVLKRKGRDSLGHVAYVEEVIDSRTLVVSHANWLNKGRLHNQMPVIDVSEANDWSAVRFWNGDGGHFGGNTYHPYGFIHQRQTFAAR
ncbi:MAG: CHAP domain-containing protein [Pseudomonadota bacterium]